ncbi:MAG: twin-arginine translocase TatA/TatE family subunit [Capsulimonadales bacterium]|nr:twin-arginine translocase TatA/TatE family subunit [Capsulimonadales bacterium]
MSGLPLTFAFISSTQDWMIVAVIALLLFGGSKIPELAKGVGEGIRELKKTMNGAEEPSESKTTDAKPSEK